MMGVIREAKVKTRTDHNCWGCLKKIEIGETVTCQTNSYDGIIYTLYTCRICDIVLSMMDSWDVEQLSEGNVPDTEEYAELMEGKS